MMRSPSAPSQARRWRSVAALATAFAVTATLAACSSGGTEAAPPPNKVTTGEYPSYYPSGYADLVAAAKKEGGELTIYSNTDQENWAPIFRDFKKKYPFITSVNANNLDSDEVFQRELSEMATGKAPADMLVSNAVQAWAEYAQNDNVLMDYKSPELQKLPDFATLMPNVYAMSLDPVGMLYNTTVIPDELKGISDLAAYAKDHAGDMKNKVTTRDVSGAWGFTVSKAWADGRTDAWDTMATVGDFARPETSSGTQKDKITSGEYAAGFLISGAVGFPAEKEAGGLLKFVLPKDGTVVLGRGIGIMPKAPHPATAKLFLDFVLSAEGQAAVAEGGLTSYRDSVKQAEGLHTYQEIESTVGADNIIRVPYQVTSKADVDAFTAKWNATLGGK